MTSPSDLSSLPLREFRPKSMLRVPRTDVARPRYPVIDAHNHLGPDFGGGWARRNARDLTTELDNAGVETIVNLDGGWGDRLSEAIEYWRAAQGRVVTFAGLDYDSWSETPDFGVRETARLVDAHRRGASGLKVWKRLGLTARDTQGTVVRVDDERLDPLWDAASRHGLPVVIHVGDPLAFFEPLDPSNERFEELIDHPEWHFWPTQPKQSGLEPGYPAPRQLRVEFERVLSRHPSTTFVGAHVASLAEDLAEVGEMLIRHPNLNVDIAERVAELGRQPYSSRAFFERHRDRVLFGLDRPVAAGAYRTYYRFLETWDESFDYGPEIPPRQGRWQIHGIGLPDDTLLRIYRDNARRVLRLL